MARHHVTETALDDGTARLLEEYLETLGTALPGPAAHRAQILAEVKDDLLEATLARLPHVREPARAARESIDDLGHPRAIAEAFRPELGVRQARRIAFGFVCSGPLVGVLWLAALVPGALTPWDAVTNPLPILGWVVPALLVAVPSALLTVALTGRLGHHLAISSTFAPGTAAVAGMAVCVVDIAALATAAVHLASSPTDLAQPVTVAAITVSVARLALATWATRSCMATRARLMVRARP